MLADTEAFEGARPQIIFFSKALLEAHDPDAGGKPFRLMVLFLKKIVSRRSFCINWTCAVY